MRCIIGVVSDGERSPAERRPGRTPPLRAVGSEPDPRFSFANERTFLAWNRTALALIGGGLAVAEFVHVTGTGLRLVLALPLIALGALTSLTSYRRWERNERAMRLGQPLAYDQLPRLLAAGIGIVALAACAVAIADVVLRP